ncbi:hypothetical protein LTR43_009736 [Exophiala xenobiotica]|nr:hypothetical protein LTR14_009602 [Exophiala xenobiotica]KAK5318220.1 hypothetical protein LTR93_008266 [Exophiala xenobiotica]KAK5404975.1 hypothetical protein LTR06_009242 [Exophiala xenobiotica]KAK5478062.1 hypothetical protein LTR55_008046 [Exophiala xenobiotica]
MASLETFPSISDAEFQAACQALEDRCFDKLNGTDWLSVRWTRGGELVIKERRPIKNSSPTRPKNNKENKRLEDEDEENVEDGSGSDNPDIILRHNDVDPDSDSLVIHFSITLSPTYRVPVLWFWCQQPQARSLHLEQIYDLLVPRTSQAPLRGVGVMGGISMAYHPISDQPAYFIHPCNTPEALSVLKPNDCKSFTPEDYLVLWLGLIGSSVGLHIPSKLFDTLHGN